MRLPASTRALARLDGNSSSATRTGFPAELRVAADEQQDRDRDRERRVADEERTPRARPETMGAVREREDRTSRTVREVRRDRVVPARGQDVQERRNHEEERSEDGDAA